MKEIRAEEAFGMLERYCNAGTKLSLFASLKGASAKWNAQVKEITANECVRLRLFDDDELSEDLNLLVSLAEAQFWHSHKLDDDNRSWISVLWIGVEGGDSFSLSEYPLPSV